MFKPAVLRLLVIVSLFVGVVCGLAQQTSSRSDEYIIYSKLIDCRDELCLIEASTVNETAAPGGRQVRPDMACVRAPVEDAVSHAEILADYDRRKDMATPFQRNFTLQKPYLLMASVEVQQFLSDALAANPQILSPGVQVPPNPNPLYPKARRIFRLGNVYFDLGKKTAVVYSASYETPYDWQGGWRIFKKAAGGDWVPETSWRACLQGSIR